MSDNIPKANPKVKPPFIPAPASASQWQPIETAPNGCVKIMVITDEEREIQIIYASDLCHYEVKDYPTHWMPLPKPPAYEARS